MTERSTRNKIRWQIKKAASQVDRIFEHLQYAEDLAAGQHPDLSEALPVLVLAGHEYQQALIDFRDSI